MADDDKIDYAKALHQLQEVTDALQKHAGRQPDKIKRVLTEPPFCSFCGKATNEVRALVPGPQVFICNECVSECVRILKVSGIDT